jgi:hypothetical protein
MEQVLHISGLGTHVQETHSAQKIGGYAQVYGLESLIPVISINSHQQHNQAVRAPKEFSYAFL